ncbi:MAG: nickel pincer cofactor biosynthesis protein LarB [Thermodesulfobacteriota bacterium]|nr:nickel pincer cofactor biosynthesis protein LarB [Thermodesulfobacteriota bacterium]
MLKETLELYKRGRLSGQEAEERILRLFYEEGEDFLLDLHRGNRIGFPEVIFAQGKTIEHLLVITEKVLEKNDIVFISNIDHEGGNKLEEAFSGLKVEKAGRVIVIKKRDHMQEGLGTVGVITAGTSDIPYAKECSLILKELGAEVINSYDTGASGVHRPHLSLKKVKDSDVLIVFAGMEGVLPTLIASMTDLPVIAVPTPIGYGFGGEGKGALTTMLQTCVPGVLVVNIGNTVGAAAGAVRVLRAIERGMGGEAKQDKKSDQG